MTEAEEYLAGEPAVYEKVTLWIKKAVWRFCSNQQDHEDLVQEVHLRLLQYANNFEPSKGDFFSYIYKTTERVCIDYYVERCKYDLMFENIEDVPEIFWKQVSKDPKLAEWRQYQQEMFEFVLEELPTRAQAILEMRWEGLTYSEIGKRLGLREGTAKHYGAYYLDILRERADKNLQKPL